MTTPASEALRRKSKIIMTTWEERAREEIASAYGASSLSLRNALPGHLVQLAAVLDSANEKSAAEIAKTTLLKEDIGRAHGKDRANFSLYSIQEVILEYRILRQVVIQALEEDVPLSLIEREIITDLTEQAVNDAAVEFSATLSDMRNQYTAILTHDLRGPITVAKANAELIKRGSDKPGLVKNATFIIESLKRMDSMIQNLLDAGRIRAGEPLLVNLGECDPACVIREVLDEMISVHGDRFVFSSGADILTWWDSDLFRRALENLLTNGVKYGAAQGRIVVSLEQNDSSVKITVHNEGNPIPENEKSTLFQNYRRSKSAERSSEGWGLGLTLVSGVVQAHHGTVEVESSEGKGTSFIMRLPKDCRSNGSAIGIPFKKLMNEESEQCK
ncbi:MAG: HAMP domain-containing sensor histidine kinase [Bdellovibrionia bacterium]